VATIEASWFRRGPFTHGEERGLHLNGECSQASPRGARCSNVPGSYPAHCDGLSFRRRGGYLPRLKEASRDHPCGRRVSRELISIHMGNPERFPYPSAPHRHLLPARFPCGDFGTCTLPPPPLAALAPRARLARWYAASNEDAREARGVGRVAGGPEAPAGEPAPLHATRRSAGCRREQERYLGSQAAAGLVLVHNAALTLDARARPCRSRR